VLHEDDAVEALRRAALGTATGAINVAGDGVLLLSQAIARLGRLPLPVALPAGRFAARLLGAVGLLEPEPEDAGFLSFGRVVDITRMREVLGFEPAYTGLEAIDSMRPARAEPADDSFVQFFSRMLAVVPDPEASADYLGRTRGGRDV
jgi:UDP-glucose 4-epimerase